MPVSQNPVHVQINVSAWEKETKKAQSNTLSEHVLLLLLLLSTHIFRILVYQYRFVNVGFTFGPTQSYIFGYIHVPYHTLN